MREGGVGELGGDLEEGKVGWRKDRQKGEGYRERERERKKEGKKGR